MEIQIERNIPAPVMPPRQKYPWDSMEVGESFLFLPHGGTSSGYIGNANRRYAPKRFVSRVTPAGVRCWRVE